MYFRIYKALNVLLWMIPSRKKVLETMVNTAFEHAFCWHVRVVERLCFCFTLINIHHCLYNCYIHICYNIVLMNKLMFLFSI